ncbi:MAG: glycoside hydrolase family 19 protein [Caulobacter sp.]|nr:glycoside hydrolase family 19 protein [Caulobacter sp.]
MPSAAQLALPDNALLQTLFPRAAAADLLALRSQEALMARAGILDNIDHLAMFLAQMDHESAGLSRKRENLNYSAARLVQVWPRRFPTLQAAQPYANNPQALANKAYGGRMGNTQPNDGWRFRGRAGLQITGREAYEIVGRLIGLDLVKTPELAETPEGSIAISVGVWMWKDFSDHMKARYPVLAVTRALNGGENGLEDRRRKFAAFRGLLRAHYG